MKSIGMSFYKACAGQLSGLGLRRFAAVNRLNELVLKLVKERTAEVHGHKMFLDRQDSLDLSVNQIYEPFETELVQRLIRPGDTVLDIGANIGYYTLLFARLVGGSGKVFAFEPDPENFALLKRNVEINGYRNVTLVNAAVSRQSGRLKLYLSEENKGDHRIYASGEDRPSIEIAAVALDDYFVNNPAEVNFIKMDVQGAEGRVMQGMERLLKRCSACQIIFEFWPLGMRRAGDEAKDVVKQLIRHGFTIHLIDEPQKRVLAVEPERLLEEFSVARGNQTNLLANRNIPAQSALT
jgi:FkbM family methyltransferase